MPTAQPQAARSGNDATLRLLAEQAFSRAAGAPLVGGNAVGLLIDARANFDAWLAAIGAARHTILFENYIFSDDAIGRAFRSALAERAAAGVRVCVLRDWFGCLGESRASFWKPLLEAGGEVRAYNPPRLERPLGWLSRDHRKLLVVDAEVGFLGGLCVSARWLGDPQRGIAPWRDTAVAVRGPAVADLARAFAEVWGEADPPLPESDAPAPVGDTDLRVIATMPNTAGLYRLDQLIAGMARTNLWLTDAYFIGMAPYVQALAAAARDGVDVRLLVPGTSDVPMVGALSRMGYRALLEAGVRVFEWNGPMLHAKTAVADGRWARVGSSNLNMASWIGNCELDVAIEDAAFASYLETQFRDDLRNATEIVLTASRTVRPGGTQQRTTRAQLGGSGHAAAGALRLASTIGAAVTGRRMLGPAESRLLLGMAALLLLLAILSFLWPPLVAWPLALLALWSGLGLLYRHARLHRRRAANQPGADG